MGAVEYNQVLESQKNSKGITSLILILIGYLLIAPLILCLHSQTYYLPSVEITITIIIFSLSITSIILGKLGLKLNKQKKVTKAGFSLGIILLIISSIYMLSNLIVWILWNS